VRIFYAAGAQPHEALRGSQVWRSNLFDALVDLGHDVVPFEYDLEPLLAHADIAQPGHRAFIERERPRADAELLRQVKAAHQTRPIDLFFSYFYSSCASAATIERIRERGIVTVNWYCNASYQLHLVADLAPAYDFCLVPERFRLEDYRRLGANPIYCQEAANPNVYRPRAVPREFDVTFVGSRYGERPAYVRALLASGIAVRVWGPGWRDDPPAHPLARARRTAGQMVSRLTGGVRSDGLPADVCGPALSDDEMVAMYSRSKISLGFSSVGETHADPERIVQVRLRDFEAPMAGAFYLVEEVPELELFFEIGKEIVCYRDMDDLVAKCRYYLEHPAEREAIRLAGHRRALAEHTWQRRLSKAFEEMGLAG
jgi:hypothetical protein